MVGANQGVEQQLSPEGQHAEGVGVDRLVEELRQKVIGKPEDHGGEPHADTLVHVVPLDHRFAEAVLVPGEVGGDDQGERPEKGGDDVPIGDVDLCDAAAGHGPVEVPGEEQEPQRIYLLYTSDAADDLLCVDLGG